MVGGNDRELAALVFFGLLGLAIYRLILWVMDAKRTEDPWGPEIDDALNQEGAAPLCHHCLEPQEHNGWFCPNCGATVGPYSNYMPYVFIFAQGELLRAGVTERLKSTPILLIGFVLVSFAFITIAAPLTFIWVLVYMAFVLENLLRRKPTGGQAPPAIP